MRKHGGAYEAALAETKANARPAIERDRGAKL